MNPLQIRNLFLVWIILTLAHFSLFQVVEFRKVQAFSRMQMQSVQRALSGESTRLRQGEVSSNEFRTQERIEYILSLPLLPLLESSERAEASSAQIVRATPVTYRFANSAAAALLWYALAFVLAGLLPHSSHTRRFLEGRKLHGEDAIPVALDRAPIIRTARLLEKTEKAHFGPAIVVAVFHFALTQIGQLLLVGARLKQTQSTPALTRLTRFPLTPLAVDDAFWATQHQNDLIKGGLAFANSLIVAIALVMLYKLLRGGGARRP